MTLFPEYIEQNFSRFSQELFELLRIPSVSTDPARTGDVRRAADWLANDLRRIGMTRVEIFPTAGHPIVYGEWMGAGPEAPTILIYGHYDVQPAVKADGWTSEPFEPVERNGYVFARGASDDKGQVMAHAKAAESLLASDQSAANLKFLIEGEEEIGSVHLGSFVHDHRDLLKADVCVISDSGMPHPDQPTIVYALRGLLTMELEVTGPTNDLHSGSYGGAVHNPAQAITEIISQLHEANGRIAVPGFYDAVIPLNDHERTELQKTAVDEAGWLKTTGIPAVWGEPGYAIHERTGARPTLEINGIASGYYGDGFKTVLPARAIAKISCRLVADQDPHHIFDLIASYVAQITPPTIRSQLRMLNGKIGARVDIETPAMRSAIRAYEQGWGKHPLFAREGGSIPVVSDFQNELGTPVILMGFGLNDDGAHGPDEHFKLDMYHRGILTAAHFYQIIGEGGL